MKNLSKTLVTISLIISTAGVVPMVSASSFEDGAGCKRAGDYVAKGKHHYGKGPDMERLAKRLDMTEEQRAQMKMIRNKYREMKVDLRDRMRQNRSELRELSRQADFDEAAIRRLAEKQGDLKAEMIVLQARQRADLGTILTEEQRARLQQMRMRKHHRHPDGKRL